MTKRPASASSAERYCGQAASAAGTREPGTHSSTLRLAGIGATAAVGESGTILRPPTLGGGSPSGSASVGSMSSTPGPSYRIFTYRDIIHILEPPDWGASGMMPT